MAETHDNARTGFRRFGYGDSISAFLVAHPDTIVGELTNHFGFAVEPTQNAAWRASIECLRNAVADRTETGWVYFEFDVPRMGRRIDAVVLLNGIVFVIEFKVGATKFLAQDIDQVVDYVLDLKHFHETSHLTPMVPVLVATKARSSRIEVAIDGVIPGLYRPICCSDDTLGKGIDLALELADSGQIDVTSWAKGRYRPTPTIVEAAMALYARHSVHDISRSDATNLGETSAFVGRVIDRAKGDRRKAICFVTGVPGAGKTLVGLDVATRSAGIEAELHAVYLSGNGPLVKVLQEALALDRVRRDAESGIKTRIGDARRQVSSFIQSVHHFRDEALRDDGPPHDHVAIFDEAQRAWEPSMMASTLGGAGASPECAGRVACQVTPGAGS